MARNRSSDATFAARKKKELRRRGWCKTERDYRLMTAWFDRPRIITEGDSWFAYPPKNIIGLEAANVIDHIRRWTKSKASILRLESNGDEVSNIVSGEQKHKLARLLREFKDVRAFRDHRGETLRASTLNIKVMSRLVSFFNHCREEGWVAKLPTNGLRVRDPISNRDKRRTFTLAELQRVFGPGWSRFCNGDDHKFHCGRLLLATGARAEEIAQLRVEDVMIERRTLSIRITNDHPEQRLKNAASRRLVPLHSALLPSFRRYVRAVERDGHEWVFHRWSRTPTQPRSSPIVTSFGMYLRKRCGIEDRRVVLHSLRHTVKQRLQDVGAPDSLVADLLGHAGQGQTNGTYGEAATVERMRVWVERLPLAEVLNPPPRRRPSMVRKTMEGISK